MGDALALATRASDLSLSNNLEATVLETIAATGDEQLDSGASQAAGLAITKQETVTDTVSETASNEQHELDMGHPGYKKANSDQDDANSSNGSGPEEEQTHKDGIDEAETDPNDLKRRRMEELGEDSKQGLQQEELRQGYLAANPLIVDSVELDWEHFKNRYGQDEGAGRHIIEALKVTNATLNEIDVDMLKRGEDPEAHSAKASATAGSSWIQRIRIQSPILIAYISNAGDGMGMQSDLDRIYTFIRPFTSLKMVHPKIKLALTKLEEKRAKSEVDATTTENNVGVDEKTKATEAAEELQSESQSVEAFPLPGMDDQIALDHLRCYVKFIDEKVAPLYDYFRDISHKKVRFNDLQILFTPGELVYWPSAGSIMSVPYPFYQPIWRIIGTSRSRYSRPRPDDININLVDMFFVDCYYIDHNGNSYGVMEGRIEFNCFTGEKTITDLPAYPIRFADGADRRLEELKVQGKLFHSFVKEHHLYYDGWTIPQELQQKSEDASDENSKYRRVQTESANTTRSSPEHVESAVVVDFDEAFKRHPSWKTNFRLPDQVDAEWEWTSDAHTVIHWADKTREECWYTFRELYMADDMAPAVWKNQFIAEDIPIVSSREGGLSEVTDENMVLLPRRLIAYALRDRKFLILDVFSLRSLVQHGDMFKYLKISSNNRRMIESLVKAHSERNKMQKQRPLLTLNQDLVYGKGAGLFILLHGAPGVGKTATAEAIAQRYNKPLFSITCGNLGLTPREVEDELKEIFRLAHLWDCVLLLDEADIFLARRDIYSLKRNALVSVFLRVLEYYSGILFLTTNRVGTIDEAFKSRIHLSLYYERLTRKQMLAIFKVNLEKLRDIESEKQKELLHTELKERDLIIKDDSIIRFAKNHWKATPRHARWNGRQIRNAFQIASSMARYDTGNKALTDRECAKDEATEAPILDDSHFELVAEIMRRFDTYFELATGETDEQAAFLGGARDDRLQNEDLLAYEGAGYKAKPSRSSTKAPASASAPAKKSRKGKSSTKRRDVYSDEEEEDDEEDDEEGEEEDDEDEEEEEEDERKPTKSKKGKSTKSTPSSRNEGAKASASSSSAARNKKKKVDSSQKRNTKKTNSSQNGKKSTKTTAATNKSSTKTSGASKASRKRRDVSEDEDEENDDDDSGGDTGGSDGTGSSDGDGSEEGSEVGSDEDDYDD